MGLEIKRNNIILGENTGKIYGIVKYPQDLEYSWLSKIKNIPGTICSINFTPIDSGIFIENTSRSINRKRGVVNSAKDPLTRSRAEKAAEGGERIINSIDQQGEAIGPMGVTIMPISKDEDLFEKACRKVESIVTSVIHLHRWISFCQFWI